MRPDGAPKTEFTFHYSAMGAGKTLEIMVNAHRIQQAGYNTVIAKPSVDKKAGEKIETRFGQMTRPVDIVLSPDDDPHEALRYHIGQSAVSGLWVAYVDEAQFLTPEQVMLLREAADAGTATVEAYGLRTDFRGEFFPGSATLLAHADHITEIASHCEHNGCGRPAVYNARFIDDVLTTTGEQVAIDGIDATYSARCSHHYHSA
jgi:thymidine kinase